MLSICVVPSKPCLFVVTFVSSSSVKLQWKPPKTPNGVITQYSIQLNEINAINFVNNTLMDTIEGLSPDTEYVLQLRAHTALGAGPSSSITFLTCKLFNLEF